jgi:hypothetical protein
VLAASLLLVLLSTPLWLDPSALYELGWGGRPSPSVMPATTPPGPAPASPATPGVVGAVVASDTFSRRSASGWGRAEVGGRYTVEGSLAGLAVEPGVGVIQLADGDAGSVVLLGVSVADASLELSFALDGLPREGELRLVAELRRNERGGGYRPAIAIRPDGAVIVGAGLRLGGTEQELSTSYVVPDLTVADGDALRLRAEAIGSDPTTIRLRVWPADEPEPGFWHVSVIDWSGALQGAGALGLGWWLDSTPSRPLTVRIDDLTLTTIVAGESQ